MFGAFHGPSKLQQELHTVSPILAICQRNPRRSPTCKGFQSAAFQQLHGPPQPKAGENLVELDTQPEAASKKLQEVSISRWQPYTCIVKLLDAKM
ncbi:hypothetical protein CCR75_001005 [Bremia lactucae]|uniref:Uncharacterized protein n=1 Tax=Bremia lactucae TaxID=4779 RepID=A0A976NY15_BRELC|nr:hypothetical protein CCR75_001005 [Bremia lactucae]